MEYIIMVIALFSTLLLLIAFFADFINSKNLYKNFDAKAEITKAKYKIVIAFITSLAWAYILL